MSSQADDGPPFLSELGSDTHSNSGPGQTDCAQKVFGLAPFFCYAHLWHMERHCNSSKGPGFNICFSCPLTSDEMLKLYRERQLKGSNLIVGLSAEAASRHGGRDIPPAFLRTLAYLFEVVKKGLPYTPLTEADIAAGSPSPTWAPPLWPTEPACPTQRIEDPMQLFQAAPYWCYLYNHEPQRSKKTPPKSATQMAEMYMSGSLPFWTPVLGLEAEVARFNSLPPCLFMTLGSIVALLSAGVNVKAIGLRELQSYDKFIGYRSASGSTNALPLVPQDSSGTSGLAHNSTSAHMPSSIPPYPTPTRNSSTHSSGSLSHLPNPSTLPPPNNLGASLSAAWPYSRMQGGGSASDAPSSAFAIPASPGGSGSIPRSNSDASGNWHSSSHTHQYGSHSGSGMLQHRRGHASCNSSSVACIPAFPSAPLSPLSPASSPASPGGALPQAGAAFYPPPIQWQTPLFKLFTSDTSRGRFQPLWWYLDLCAPAGMHGPISAEHMIIGYLQGTLGDSSMVCGVTSECSAHHRPTYDSFEPIGVLLEKINQGGHYVLVTLNEMLGLPPAVTAAPSLPTYQPPAPLPTYTPSPAPLPTYTPSPAPLPTYTPSPAPLPTYTPSPAPLPTYQPAPAPASQPSYVNTSMPSYGMPSQPASSSPTLLPTYMPSTVATSSAPEPSRLVQPSRGVGGGGAGLVGVPPPYGLPPTHHALSPRNLSSLRNGQNRQKPHSASRTSLASSGDLQHQQHQHQQLLQGQQGQFQDPQAPEQLPHDPHQHQPQHQQLPGVAGGVLSRSSLDSGSSVYPGPESDSLPNSKSSPPRSPPSEIMQPLATATAACHHPDHLPVHSEQQPQQLQPPPLPPQQQQQQQQQAKPGGGLEQQELQCRLEASPVVPSAAANIVLVAGQKGVSPSKHASERARESDSADKHNMLMSKKRTALSGSGNVEQTALSLST